VRQSRALHQAALEPEYKARVAAATGREVRAVLCSVHADPDLAVEVFLLA
jgi:hypothetical protein